MKEITGVYVGIKYKAFSNQFKRLAEARKEGRADVSEIGEAGYSRLLELHEAVTVYLRAKGFINLADLVSEQWLINKVEYFKIIDNLITPIIEDDYQTLKAKDYYSDQEEI